MDSFAKDNNYEIIILERINQILIKLKIVVMIVIFLYSIHIYYIAKGYYDMLISYF
jgi:hypothetical protein